MGRLRSMLLAAGLAASSAQATWSIILIDLRTGEVAVGSATCLTNFDLRVNTPVLITGVGAATAQSFVDQTGLNRIFIRDGLLAGDPTDAILAGLSVFDQGHQTRQYGIADTQGNATTFSGSGAGPWAGGRTGSFVSNHGGVPSTIIYAIQGNVLAGPQVVDDAVDAAINTEGDLAEKLMASMQAARLMGGDGRCSCSSGGPACGTPPPGFDPDTDKSAHIAYMLIARPGDIDTCLGLEPVEPAGYGVALADADGDGVLDAFVSANTGVFRMPNASIDPYVTFGTPEQVGAIAGQSRRIEVGDVTGDGVADAVAASSNLGQIYVLPGLGNGAFGAARVFSPGGAPAVLRLAHLNADGVLDIASTNGAPGMLTVLLSDGAGNHTMELIPLGGNSVGVEAMDIDGDGDVDLLCPIQATDEVRIVVNDGSDGFVLGDAIGVGDEPQDVVTLDLEPDGDLDLVVANRAGQSLTVLRREGPGFVSSSVALPVRPRMMKVGDVDGDGVSDVVCLNVGGVGFTSVLNVGGTLTVEGAFPAPGATDLDLADMNGDGAADVVCAGGPTGLVVSTNTGDGRLRFAPSQGCGSGDYFLALNIANQSAAAADPVIQLQNQFDDWRTALANHADALLSEVESPAGLIPANGTSAALVRVRLRDWQGLPATSGATFRIEADADSPGQVELESVSDLGGGEYDLHIRAGLTKGAEQFRIVVEDGGRPVPLFATGAVNLADARADFNGDGVINNDDIGEFILAFAAGEARADLTGGSDPSDPDFGSPDGVLDASDLFVLLDFMSGL